MRNFMRTAILALPLFIPTVGWTRAGELLSLQPESKLWVEGKSSIKDWSCKATDVNAVVEAASANAVPQLLTGDKAVKTVNVTLSSEKMDCGNGTMNEHMRKALKTSEFSAINFHLNSYDLARKPEGVSGTMTGVLTLGGVKKPVTIEATGTDEKGALHVLGSYDLKMTDYDLTPPSLMFGRIKVRELVTVKFDLLLKN